MVSRRALLAGGAVALLAGCGEEDEAVTAPADALRRQLEAENAFAAATARRAREISARARGRAARLAAALSAERGEPPDAPPDERVSPEEAVARGRAAIVAHVVALPSFTGRELRELAGELVIGAAADTALLADALGVPYEDAFPGTPT